MKKLDFVKSPDQKSSTATFKILDVNLDLHAAKISNRFKYQCGIGIKSNMFGYGRTPAEAARDYKKLLLKALDDVNELLEEKGSGCSQ